MDQITDASAATQCCHAANATISPGAMLGRASEPLSHLKPWCTWSLALMRIGNVPTCHQVKRAIQAKVSNAGALLDRYVPISRTD